MNSALDGPGGLGDGMKGLSSLKASWKTFFKWQNVLFVFLYPKTFVTPPLFNLKVEVSIDSSMPGLLSYWDHFLGTVSYAILS